jgi:hypothetical protein
MKTSKHDAAIVFTMGRCGSKSLHEALRRADIAAYHIHTLMPDRIARLLEISSRAPHLKEAQKILSAPPENPLWISCAREPIARNLSGFFNNASPDMSVDAALDKFINKYPHDRFLNWFDDEFGPATGVDVYDRPFNPVAMVNSQNNAVWFRDDLPNVQKSEVLSNMLGTEIKVVRSNESANKKAGELYLAAKQVACFSQEFVSRFYDSKYARHFWTDEERSEFTEKWSDTRISVTPRN